MQSSWDEELSAELSNEWQLFTRELANVQGIEIHGFSDASEKAYAAVVYLKVGQDVQRLTAKAKVNPIRNRKTLPKLELNAAHLLSKLLQKVSEVIGRKHLLYAWSDSTITLSWIKRAKNKDKFVRNRVAEIVTRIPNAKWNHVSSKDNPADVASRGICALQLHTYSLWWNGPTWLKYSAEYWPGKEDKVDTALVATALHSSSVILDLINKYSSYSKLQRIMAFILRFTKKLKGGVIETPYLSVEELEEAERIVIRARQGADFRDKLLDLRRNKSVNLPYNQQHPAILNKSHLATIIIHMVHLTTLHGGNRLVEAMIRLKYWITGMRNCIKKSFEAARDVLDTTRRNRNN